MGITRPKARNREDILLYGCFRCGGPHFKNKCNILQSAQSVAAAPAVPVVERDQKRSFAAVAASSQNKSASQALELQLLRAQVTALQNRVTVLEEKQCRCLHSSPAASQVQKAAEPSPAKSKVSALLPAAVSDGSNIHPSASVASSDSKAAAIDSKNPPSSPLKRKRPEQQRDLPTESPHKRPAVQESKVARSLLSPAETAGTNIPAAVSDANPEVKAASSESASIFSTPLKQQSQSRSPVVSPNSSLVSSRSAAIKLVSPKPSPKSSAEGDQYPVIPKSLVELSHCYAYLNSPAQKAATLAAHKLFQQVRNLNQQLDRDEAKPFLSDAQRDAMIDELNKKEAQFDKLKCAAAHDPKAVQSLQQFRAALANCTPRSARDLKFKHLIPPRSPVSRNESNANIRLSGSSGASASGASNPV